MYSSLAISCSVSRLGRNRSTSRSRSVSGSTSAGDRTLGSRRSLPSVHRASRTRSSHPSRRTPGTSFDEFDRRTALRATVWTRPWSTAISTAAVGVLERLLVVAASPPIGAARGSRRAGCNGAPRRPTRRAPPSGRVAQASSAPDRRLPERVLDRGDPSFGIVDSSHAEGDVAAHRASSERAPAPAPVIDHVAQLVSAVRAASVAPCRGGCPRVRTGARSLM